MPRKGENIYKRKDGRWEGRYIRGRTHSGKAQYGYVYARTYKEAKSKLIDAASTAVLPNHTPLCNPDYTFKDLAKEWFQAIVPSIKESSANKYRNLLESYILPYIGSSSLEQLNYNVIDEHCQYLLSKGGSNNDGLSTKTVSDTLSIIRNILKYSEQKGITISNSVYSVRIKKHTKEMRVLSRAEQDRLCDYLCADLNMYNIGILTCLFTGLRVGEICALQWEDISLTDGTIRVRRTMQRIQDLTSAEQKTRIVITPPKSSCSIRTIPIPENLCEVLRTYCTAKSGYFLGTSDKAYLEPRSMQNHFKKALKRSSIEPANYHTLRHTFATRCIEVGFDVKSLSEILGHASVNITMNRYVHPSMELKQENMQRLSSLFAVK